MTMAQLALRDGLDQPRPLQQVEAWLADGQLQQGLPDPGPLMLIGGSWAIGIQELQALAAALQRHGLVLTQLESSVARTRVAAAAAGIAWQAPAAGAPEGPSGDLKAAEPLRIHQGTLRAGDHLESEGSLLVLGDVNPGARVEARGHVLVWGTLRGVAHAGNRGDHSARITALQLRPVQLRIAEAVARGPAELPVPGVAEQAELVAGLITINPAAPQWPLV